MDFVRAGVRGPDDHPPSVRLHNRQRLHLLTAGGGTEQPGVAPQLVVSADDGVDVSDIVELQGI